MASRLLFVPGAASCFAHLVTTAKNAGMKNTATKMASNPRRIQQDQHVGSVRVRIRGRSLFIEGWLDWDPRWLGCLVWGACLNADLPYAGFGEFDT
jgi:hypothetical protein